MPFGSICLYIVSPRSILCDRTMNVLLKCQLKGQLRDSPQPSPQPCPPWWVYILDQPPTQRAMPQQLEFMVQNQGKEIQLGPLAITSYVPNAEFSFLSSQSYILPELCPGSQALSWHGILDWINKQREESLKWMANQFWFLWGPTVAAKNEGR